MHETNPLCCPLSHSTDENLALLTLSWLLLPFLKFTQYLLSLCHKIKIKFILLSPLILSHALYFVDFLFTFRVEIRNVDLFYGFCQDFQFYWMDDKDSKHTLPSTSCIFSIFQLLSPLLLLLFVKLIVLTFISVIIYKQFLYFCADFKNLKHVIS